MILYRNGQIYTMNPEQPCASSLRVSKGRIVAVGELSPDEGEAVEDLKGAVVVPGLWDAHLHLLWWSQKLGQVDLSGCNHSKQVLERVAVRAAGSDGWVLGHGWTEHVPTREQLDKFTAGHPAVLWRADLHSVQCNSAALAHAEIGPGTPDPPGGTIVRDKHGKPTGRLLELAIGLVQRVIPPPTDLHVDTALRHAVSRLHEYGITAVCDQRLKEGTDGTRSLEAFRRLALKLRISCNLAQAQLDEIEEKKLKFRSGNDWVRLGHVKFFSDGSMGSRTAMLFEPYRGESGHGTWLTPPEELKGLFRRTRKAGFPISIHAIGDRAIRACLDAFEELGPAGGLNRIEHVQILAEEDLPRVARLGITASMQPVHLLDDMELADSLLGPRAAGYYRLASLAHSGARLAFGSDAPVATPDPWLGMFAAVNRRRPAQFEPWYPLERLDAGSALAAYTRGAAAAAGWGRESGTLEPGKLADFILLDREPFAHPEGLHEVKVVRTVVGGETVFQRKGY